MTQKISALELAKKCHNRELKAVDLVQASLDKIVETDDTIKAYVNTARKASNKPQKLMKTSIRVIFHHH